VGWEESVTKADAIPLDAKEKSSWFVVGIRAPIDDDAVARMKWGEDFIQFEPIRPSAGDLARKRAAFLSEAGVDELLMIDPVEPS
jgi:hypothetical protein